ncbi:MAG: flagellar hook-basal body complex protein FliE [Pseudomonadota bacterium]
MDVKALDALGAYNKTAALKAVPGAEAAGAAQASTAGFASMVEEGLNEVVGATSGMESAVAGKLNGQAQLLDVVTAVSSAEMAVETVVAVRDKVLSAYNDIIKMPI